MFPFTDNQISSSCHMLISRVRYVIRLALPALQPPLVIDWKAQPGVYGGVDDAEAGYTEVGTTWDGGTLPGAIGIGYRCHPPGTGVNVAAWTSNDLTPGSYEVFATWAPYPNRSTDAGYAVYDGDRLAGRSTVNQQVPPDDPVNHFPSALRAPHSDHNARRIFSVLPRSRKPFT